MRFRALPFLYVPLLIALPAGLGAAVEDLKSSDPKVREKAAKEIGNNPVGEKANLCEWLSTVVADPVKDVRSEALIAMIKINAPQCLDGLIKGARDADAEVQSLAVDGIVNFYLPGYVQFGWLNSIKSFGSSLKKRFRDPEPVVVEPYVKVRDDAVEAIARLIGGGSSMESRANAARAAGILRGEDAIPALKTALKSRDETITIESIRALEKIGDTTVGPDIVPLLSDLDEDVQETAAVAVGQLRVREAVDDLVSLVKGGKKDVRRAALTALAKIPENGQDRLFLLYLNDKDDDLRAAAAEGLGRLGAESDLKTLQDAYAAEKDGSARLSMAFGAVMLGDLNMVSTLVDALNSTVHRGEARAFLIEGARRERVLAELYTPLTSGTRDQKVELADIIARSGTRESLPHLERLASDPDTRVSQAANTAIRNLTARL